MRRNVITTALAFTGAIAIQSPLSADEDPLLQESRAIISVFATEMQTALQEALAAGGPVGAIDVCKEVAPDIAENLSLRTGATVGRTSLRLRNPANAPADWQLAVLEAFEDSNAPLEFFERTGNNGARYMKAIPAGGLCLTCHGTELADDIAARLAEAYPQDEATGYSAGEVRGAFSVVWPDSP